MRKYDLVKQADARDVVRALTNEYITKSGGQMAIRCPVHEQVVGRPDQHIGNCVVKPSGAYCFSCNSYIPIKQLISCYRPDVDPYDWLSRYYGVSIDESEETKELFHYDTETLKDIGYEGTVPETPEELEHAMKRFLMQLKSAKKSYTELGADGVDTLVDLLGDQYDVSVLSDIKEELNRRTEIAEKLLKKAKYFIQQAEK